MAALAAGGIADPDGELGHGRGDRHERPGRGDARAAHHGRARARRELTQARIARLMTGQPDGRGGARMRRELGMFGALVLICLAAVHLEPRLPRASRTPSTRIRQISMLGIYAIGIGFVIITGGIDLSVGSVVGLTGVHHRQASPSQATGRRRALAGAGHHGGARRGAAGRPRCRACSSRGSTCSRSSSRSAGCCSSAASRRRSSQGGTLSLGDVAAAQAGQRRPLHARRRSAAPVPAADLPGGDRARRLPPALHGVRPLRLRHRRQPRRGRVLGHPGQAGRDHRPT